MSKKTGALRAILICTAFAAMSAASPVIAGAADQQTIVLRHVKTDSEAATRQLLRRIDTAAMEACGASTFSLVEWQQTVRGSQCWRDTRAQAIRQVGSEGLAALSQRYGS